MQDLAPGLYDHPLNEALHEALAAQPVGLNREHALLDPVEAPQRLARYLRQLSEIALATLPEAQRQQLALVNRIVAVLQEQAPKTITAGDRLHPSARLLQELRAAPLLPGQEAITRPLIPLADGTLLINALSEPSVGLALQAEVPSADRIDLLCAFIKWSGLRLLQPVLKQYLAAGRSLRVLTTVYMGVTSHRIPLHPKVLMEGRRIEAPIDFMGYNRSTPSGDQCPPTGGSTTNRPTGRRPTAATSGRRRRTPTAPAM
jgi:hypothetical protein